MIESGAENDQGECRGLSGLGAHEVHEKSVGREGNILQIFGNFTIAKNFAVVSPSSPAQQMQIE